MSDAVITDRYSLYHDDCLAVMPSCPDRSVHLSLYSPPFGGLLYQYSSDPRDLSNSTDYTEFFEHYAFVVREIARLTMPGRMTLVHCMEIPDGGDFVPVIDFPGDIIRLHLAHGFEYAGRYHVWKEPLTVRNRTMLRSLHHKTLVSDSSKVSLAHADYLLRFRRKGANPVPIGHPTGLMDYAGERRPPADVLRWRGWRGNQIENQYSQWIWRQYASSFWDDIRLDRVLRFREAREEGDESHIHPLQLDVIERAITLWSNPHETVLTPFAGVGSEVYEAVRLGRRGIGVELKASYYRQAVRNVPLAMQQVVADQYELLPADVDAGVDAAGLLRGVMRHQSDSPVGDQEVGGMKEQRQRRSVSRDSGQAPVTPPAPDRTRPEVLRHRAHHISRKETPP